MLDRGLRVLCRVRKLALQDYNPLQGLEIRENKRKTTTSDSIHDPKYIYFFAGCMGSTFAVDNVQKAGIPFTTSGTLLETGTDFRYSSNSLFFLWKDNKKVLPVCELLIFYKQFFQ